MYVYGTTCMPGAHRKQKRMSDTLELELETVVGHYVGDGIELCKVLCKSNKYTSLLSQLSSRTRSF